MGLSLYNIRKWIKMLCGTSILHVPQNLGLSFSAGYCHGYFNDLTQKVLKESSLLKSDQLPMVKTEKGQWILFPVAVFQYGLGAWDLYLQTDSAECLRKVLQSADWAIGSQESSGAWNSFFFVYPDHPYSAMCQGEGASLLLRAYILTKDNKFLSAAKIAIDFMLKPVEEGGTSRYVENDLFLLEYTHLPAVLNGWVFALFGLYDIVLISGEQYYQSVLDQSLSTLCSSLPSFNRGFWSQYDLGGKIASPFYHKLHSAQMKALHMVGKQKIFEKYSDQWEKNAGNIAYKTAALAIKCWQKLIE